MVNATTGQITSNSSFNENIVEIQCDNTRFSKEFYTHIQEEKQVFTDLSIYPNPTKDKLNFDFIVSNPQDINICVVNNLGQIIYQENHKNYQGKYSGSINTYSFAAGVYVLNIKVGENTHTQNITVLH